LYNGVPALFGFSEDLTNWYIRLNRSRFWTEGLDEDKQAAYSTLYTTIYELSLSMAPFAPFLSETIYQALREYGNEDLPSSVHLCMYPEARESMIKPLLERAVTRMQHIILLGRQKRNQSKIKTKYPLANLTILHRDTELLDEISRLEDYIKSELNVKNLEYSTAESDYINLYAKPNAPVLGKRFGKRFKEFKQLIEQLDSDSINRFQQEGSMTLEGEHLGVDDLLVFREAREGTHAISDRFISIDMKCELNDELIKEGLAREVINRVQRSRKELGLNVVDRINLKYAASDELESAIEERREHIMNETLAVDMMKQDAAGLDLGFDIDDYRLDIAIEKAG
ncbi:MAG: class I tRNA ligase family protein, partial [Pseudomonadales bacterium]|nr:class I tRNA ligase family protein [Pseudomonadales bacterium]